MRNSITLSLFIPGIKSRSFTAVHQKTDKKETVADILAFLESLSKNFTLGESKDVVLVLGMTGVGKSTVTLLLTDAELESRKGKCQNIFQFSFS